MKILYIGNFGPLHSTESHVRTAWLAEGHEVIRIQEENGEQWSMLESAIVDKSIDLILWTRTASLADQIGHRRQWRMLTAARNAGIPTVAFHLDRWWGLNREATVWEEPFFRCEYVITADGGHQHLFEELGINHYWLPPAVSLPETELGVSTDEFRAQMAFVGSWQAGYHIEWNHRSELIAWLKKNYPQTQFWPRPNQHAVRGEALRNLYASTDIVIGDSCLAGNATHYWSDRIPETIGRGGFLIHPHVEGIEDHYNVGDHLWTWNVGDWDELRQAIESAIASPDAVAEVREEGRRHVRKHHTYERRVEQILDIVNG